MNYDNLCSNCLLKQKRKFEDIIIMAYVILSKFIFCTYFEFENWKCYFAAWFFFSNPYESGCSFLNSQQIYQPITYNICFCNGKKVRIYLRRQFRVHCFMRVGFNSTKILNSKDVR